MDVLVITDIPRMTELFERIGQDCPGLAVLSEIHRGIEELENHKPSVVVIQNHLAGLSADILHKHLKSRLGGKKLRFALISASVDLDVDLSSRFEVILDPALPDEQLEEAVRRLFRPTEQPKRRDEPVIPAPAEPLVPQTELLLPGLLPHAPEAEQPVTEPQTADIPDHVASAASNELDPHSITYGLPRRPGLSIISDFSKQLDTRADGDSHHAEPFKHREQELGIRDFRHDSSLITDFDEPRPWFRRTGILLVATTLLIVVGVSLFQHRTSRTTVKLKPASVPTSATLAAPAVKAPVVPDAPVVPPAPVVQPLASHGVGRPHALPGFIPKEGHDPGYAKDHPGWDHYRGQTVEYRVFREKDRTIKAIQVLDRSGAGIQESFYTSMLKELAGVTAMRPTSSEIKEGYEIRRGEVAGLQLVQYRDAQGGRMRGFVVTWP